MKNLSPKLPEKVVFLDLEATGLEQDAQIIEVAAIFAELKGTVYIPTDVQLWVSGDPISRSMTQDVINMHTHNRLFDEMDESSEGEYDLNAKILSKITNRHVLAGRCVHLDRAWLYASFGKHYGSHRILDVTTLSMVGSTSHNLWAKLLHRVKNVPVAVTGRHRALRDVIDDFLAVNNFFGGREADTIESVDILRSFVVGFCV